MSACRPGWRCPVRLLLEPHVWFQRASGHVRKEREGARFISVTRCSPVTQCLAHGHTESANTIFHILGLQLGLCDRSLHPPPPSLNFSRLPPSKALAMLTLFLPQDLCTRLSTWKTLPQIFAWFASAHHSGVTSSEAFPDHCLTTCPPPNPLLTSVPHPIILFSFYVFSPVLVILCPLLSFFSLCHPARM